MLGSYAFRFVLWGGHLTPLRTLDITPALAARGEENGACCQGRPTGHLVPEGKKHLVNMYEYVSVYFNWETPNQWLLIFEILSFFQGVFGRSPYFNTQPCGSRSCSYRASNLPEKGTATGSLLASNQNLFVFAIPSSNGTVASFLHSTVGHAARLVCSKVQ